MKLTAEQVDAELLRLGVGETTTSTGLTRATGIDARTLKNKADAGVMGQKLKGPRKGSYFKREDIAAYFAGPGKAIWEAASSRRVPTVPALPGVGATSPEEEWRRPNPRHFAPDQRPLVALLVVSNLGCVRTAIPRRGSPAGRVLNPPCASGGYRDVYLTLPPSAAEKRRARLEGRSPDRGAKNLAIHRLVASAWCHRKRGATEVHHLDGDRANNAANNLAWVTRKENAEIARQQGGVGRSWGRPSAKLWPEDIADILTRRQTAQQYAEKHGVGVRQIFRIWSGDQWKRMRPAG